MAYGSSQTTRAPRRRPLTLAKNPPKSSETTRPGGADRLATTIAIRTIARRAISAVFSALLQLDSYEARLAAGLDPHQHGLAPELGGLLDAVGHVLRILDRKGPDLEDHIARFDALLGGVGAVVDIGDHDAVLVGAGAGSHAQAQLVHLGRLRLRGRGLAALDLGQL